MILDPELRSILDGIRIDLGRYGIKFALRDYTAADLRGYGKVVDRLSTLIRSESDYGRLPPKQLGRFRELVQTALRDGLNKKETNELIRLYVTAGGCVPAV